MLSPDPADEQAYVAFLAELAERSFSEPAVVFPTHDAPLAARRAQRRAAGRLPAARAAAGTCSSRCSRSATSTRPPRRAGRRRAAHVRRRRPRTRPRAAAAELRYPAVVKPSATRSRSSAASAGPCSSAQTPEELIEAWRSAADCEPMLQEVVPGDDATLWTVGSYTDAVGHARSASSAAASSCRCRAASAPAGSARRAGATTSSSRRSRCSTALGFHGIAQTEFRLDPRDGRFKLMEVNPRLWQWHGLARACGVDLPRIAYVDVLGRPQRPVRSGPEHDGRRWVVAAAHLRASRARGHAAAPRARASSGPRRRRGDVRPARPAAGARRRRAGS